MGRLLVLMLFLAAVYLLVQKLKGAGGGSARNWPVFPRSVLTAPEQILYRRLIEALPEYLVFAQVALPSFIRVKKGADFGKVFNRYNRLIADFVICRADSSVVAVIELDDKSHERPDRQAADAKKHAVLEAAGIPLHRYAVKAIPTTADLRAQWPPPPTASARAQLSAPEAGPRH